jgi:hypothetical protein
LKYKYIAYAICQVMKDEPSVCENIDVIVPINTPKTSKTILLYCYAALVALVITALVCIMVQRWKYSRIMDIEVKKKIDRYY